MDLLWGIGGALTILLIAFALSVDKKAIKLRPVLGGLAIQVSFAVIVLKWELGRKCLHSATLGVQQVIDNAYEGINFMFGPLADLDGFFKPLAEGGHFGIVFAFHVLPIIIFFSSLISVLYYLGVMQVVIKIIGGGLSKLLGTSKAESMSAAANIFVGQTEAPLVIRPFIEKMTQSELFAVMTGGLATVAGSVLMAYHILGVPLEYLLAASFMAAPAGLVMAKIIMPETSGLETSDAIHLEKDEKTVNVIDAAAKGAADGLKLALMIGAMLLAFISLIALVNGLLGFTCGLAGVDDITMEQVLGYAFAPIAFAVGVPWSEAIEAGSFIGQKVILNEFVAYSAFAPEMENLSEKTNLIISFALCGFANLGSLAVLLGGIGELAPNRRPDIARNGLRAVAAGALASLLSAAIAGALF